MRYFYLLDRAKEPSMFSCPSFKRVAGCSCKSPTATKDKSKKPRIWEHGGKSSDLKTLDYSEGLSQDGDDPGRSEELLTAESVSSYLSTVQYGTVRGVHATGKICTGVSVCVHL